MKPVYINYSLRSMAVLSGALLSGEVAERRERAAKLPPQSPRGFSALARLYCLARPTKAAMLRSLYQLLLKTESLDNAILEL